MYGSDKIYTSAGEVFPQPLDLSQRLRGAAHAMQARALQRFTKERLRQMHGIMDGQVSYTVAGDANKTLGDFLVFIDVYVDKAKRAYQGHDPDALEKAERELEKIGALALAYFESREYLKMVTDNGG